MKLNFDYCIKCDLGAKYFGFRYESFFFFCSFCGWFDCDIKNYPFVEENKKIIFEQITEKQLIKLKKMDFYQMADHFNNCPYKLEHMVES